MSKLSYEEWRARRLYRAYKLRARKKVRVFELSLEQFIALVTAPCFYCTTPAIKNLHGVDRIDSKLGYSTTNCVPACTLCNQMKWSTPVDKFLKQVEKIYEANFKIQKDPQD